MKKLASKITALIIAAIMLITSVTPAYAFFSDNTQFSNNINGYNWMNAIRDDTLLSDISIPGTHDSGAKSVDSITSRWAQTQDMSIYNQLYAGVRYLDLRLEYSTDVYRNVRIVHGSIKCWNDRGGHLTLDEVLNSVYSFLANYPSETVIVSVKHDAGDINALAPAVNDIINLASNFWYTGSSTPTLDSVRGKCVLASRIGQIGRGISLNWGDQGSDGGAVNSGYMQVQDRYNMNPWNKWENAVKPMLNETKPKGKWFISFLSTTGGGIDGVGVNADAMKSYFRPHEFVNNKCYGIIVFDYINDDYARKVYKCNDLVAKNQPSSENGQYYYRINFNTTDDITSGWNNVSMRLHYRVNNGTGEERSVLIFDNSGTYNGYYYVTETWNTDFSGYVDGFPTKIEFKYSWQNGTDGLAITQRLYVSAKPGDTMTLCVKNEFSDSSSDSYPAQNDDFYYTMPSVYPFATTMSFTDSSDAIVNVPDVNSSWVNSYNFNSKIYDQYGVRWYAPATSYALGAAYKGITISGNTLQITKDANDLPNGTSFYIYGKYKDAASNLTSSGKKVIVNTNKIRYSFLNYDGKVLQEGDAYAGEIPAYTAAAPTKAPDENSHYTFSGWSSTAPLSMANNTYTATYSTNQHIVSQTRVTLKPTCTEDGYNTNYCSCGYSWTVPTSATGHTMVTEAKDATCTENGYTRTCCKNCDYVESQTDVPALEHDYENAYAGKHVGANENHNGYTPYLCPVCNEELEDLRVYDSISWSNYYDAVNKFESIIENDPNYNSYASEITSALETAVAEARTIEEIDHSAVIQLQIDTAEKKILDAIDAFGKAVHAEYFTLTFIFTDGSIKKLTYKSQTASDQIDIPENTATLITDSRHTIYRWPTVKDVTQDAVYRENSASSNHTFNTYIFPDETHSATCTEDGYIKHTCLCGYSCNEKTSDATGHSFGDWQSNSDGTHSRICANDPSHIESENCIINLSSHKCIICDYSLDLSAYNSASVTAQSELKLTEKYTAESLENLSAALQKAQEDIALADTQKKIDDLVFALQTAISQLKLNEFVLTFYCIIDDDSVINVEEYSKKYNYGENIELTVPANVLNGAVVEKWTVENLTNGITEKISSTADSVTAVAENDTEYTAYLSSGKNTVSDTVSSVTVLDRSGKIADIIYLPNGAYDISVTDNTISLSSEENVYSLTARNYVFYNISSFTINGEIIPSAIEIRSNTVITPVYTA